MTPELQSKLHPRRAPNMSGMMAAVVAYVIGVDPITDPAMTSLMVTVDRFVFAMNAGDIGHNQFIGSLSDFEDNWRRWLDATGCSDAERRMVQTAMDSKIDSWGTRPSIITETVQ